MNKCDKDLLVDLIMLLQKRRLARDKTQYIRPKDHKEDYTCNPSTPDCKNLDEYDAAELSRPRSTHRLQFDD